MQNNNNESLINNMKKYGAASKAPQEEGVGVNKFDKQRKQSSQ